MTRINAQSLKSQNDKVMKGQYFKSFLGITISNTGNGDGYVIIDSNKCSVANFSKLEMAQRYCVGLFFIKFSMDFESNIMHRLTGHGGTYLEWIPFEKLVKQLGIKMPKELSPIDGSNMIIGYKGKPVFPLIHAKNN